MLKQDRGFERNLVQIYEFGEGIFCQFVVRQPKPVLMNAWFCLQYYFDELA